MPKKLERTNVFQSRFVGDKRKLRVTSLQAFEQCPRKWAAEHFELVPRGDSKYARIGTAVHSVVERFLTGTVDAGLSNDDTALWLKRDIGMDPAEIENLKAYLANLREMDFTVIALEHEFSTQSLCPDDMPAIWGHIDCVARSKDGSLLVIDHKTNRSYEDVNEWRHKLQPLIYAYAARRIWTGFHRVRFMIGYVNMPDVFVEWEVTQSDDMHVVQRVENIWKDFVSFMREDEFAPRFGEVCKYCSCTSSCPAYRQCVEEFKESAQGMLEGRSLPEQYVLLDTVKKVAEGMLEAVKVELAQVIAKNDGPVTTDGFVFSLEYSEKRGVDFSKFWPTLWAALDEEGEEVWAQVRALYDDLFTVKVGGVDKLAKECPQFADALAAIVVKKRSETPSVKVTKGKKALTS